jgi:hypothetical protein
MALCPRVTHAFRSKQSGKRAKDCERKEYKETGSVCVSSSALQYFMYMTDTNISMLRTKLSTEKWPIYVIQEVECRLVAL